MLVRVQESHHVGNFHCYMLAVCQYLFPLIPHKSLIRSVVWIFTSLLSNPLLNGTSLATTWNIKGKIFLHVKLTACLWVKHQSMWGAISIADDPKDGLHWISCIVRDAAFPYLLKVVAIVVVDANCIRVASSRTLFHSLDQWQQCGNSYRSSLLLWNLHSS